MQELNESNKKQKNKRKLLQIVKKIKSIKIISVYKKAMFRKLYSVLYMYFVCLKLREF